MTHVTVVKGNIVNQTGCDGVVNSANRNLRAGGGVCGAIYAAAGCKLEPYSVQFAPLLVGEALATPAFDMCCRFIIHTRGPKYLEDEDPPLNLARAMRSALVLADENGIQRLAVPAISMGVYGYPANEAVPILVGTTFETISSLRNLKEIRFTVGTNDLLALFRTVLDQRYAS